MRSLLAIIVCMFASSCVATQGDVAALQAAFENANREHEADLRDVQRGVITPDEFRARMDERNAETVRTINEVKENVTARVEAVAETVAAHQGVTGNPLIDLVLGGVAATGTAIYGTNKMRDRKRVLRGEPVMSPYHAPPVAMGGPYHTSSPVSSPYHGPGDTVPPPAS